jgi:hypothetical protein
MDILPVLKKGRFVILYAPHAATRESMEVIVELGLRGPVTIFDGGNRYQPYRIARLLRRKTVDIEIAARHLTSRRAFTCYELTALLSSTPALTQPHIILDLLGTFQDDHIPLHEARRLLESCLLQIERLTMQAPVLVTLAPLHTEERAFLLKRVCDQANEIFVQEIPAACPVQPPLF